jgi:hypothetical protein
MSSTLPLFELTLILLYHNSMISIILRTCFSALRSHHALTRENLALRHQLEVLKRNTKRPRLENRDRLFGIIHVRFWNDRRKPLILVQPETVIRVHKKGFQLYWRWQNRPRWPGRKKVSREVRDPIRTMSRDNPLRRWFGRFKPSNPSQGKRRANQPAKWSHPSEVNSSLSPASLNSS